MARDEFEAREEAGGAAIAIVDSKVKDEEDPGIRTSTVYLGDSRECSEKSAKIDWAYSLANRFRTQDAHGWVQLGGLVQAKRDRNHFGVVVDP